MTAVNQQSQPVPVLFAIGTMGGGGAERQMIEILKHLDRKRFRPCLYLIHREGELLPEIPNDVPVFAFWERHAQMGLKYPGRIARTQMQDLANVIREQQIQVVYHRCYLMNLLGAKACRLANVPHVAATVVDPEPELKLYSRFSDRWSWYKARQAYQKADVVLANSQGLAQRVRDYFKLPVEKVQTIYNLFDPERIERLAAEPGPDWAPNHFHLICVARLHRQKGQHVLIEALHQLVKEGQTQIQLHLYGQGEAENELRQQVDQLELSKYVRFEGFHSNPLPALKQANLFCLPSLYEGMPNSLVEAILCRTPVVATDCPSGPREILQDDLLPPNNPEALAAAIRTELRQPTTPEKLEERRNSVLQRFGWQSGLVQLQELLLSLVEH